MGKGYKENSFTEIWTELVIEDYFKDWTVQEKFELKNGNSSAMAPLQKEISG